MPEVLILLPSSELYRGHQVKFGPLRFSEDRVDHLVDALGADRNVALGAMHLTEPGHQDAEVIVDFSDRPDRRSGRMTGGTLLDGNRRRQAFNRFDAWLLQLADELAGVGAEAFDVASLPLGVDRVHGKRTFAAAAGTAEDGEFIARDLHAHIAEIVLASTFDDDVRGLLDWFSRLVGLVVALSLAVEVRGEGGGGVRYVMLGSFRGTEATSAKPIICSGVPVAMISPPCLPPSGPTSMTQSAVFHHVQIVFDDQHRVARVDKFVQHLEQHFDVGEVQTGCRLVEQIQRAAGGFLDQLAGELDSLGLSTRERGRRLSQLEVVESYRVQRFQLVSDRRDIFKVFERLLHIHFQHVGN